MLFFELSIPSDFIYTAIMILLVASSFTSNCRKNVTIAEVFRVGYVYMNTYKKVFSMNVVNRKYSTQVGK